MTSLPATAASAVPADLVRDSIKHVIAVSFPKSKSAGYGAAVNIAQQADKYAFTDLDGTLYHYAAFGRTREQVALALAAVRYLAGLKAVQCYAGGKLILERHRVESVLTCYLEACACADHRAHCNKVIGDPFATVEHTSTAPSFRVDLVIRSSSGYLFPCAFLTQWGRPELHRHHPASPTDQIQAMAVRKGCDWCPNFKPGDFKKL